MRDLGSIALMVGNAPDGRVHTVDLSRFAHNPRIKDAALERFAVKVSKRENFENEKVLKDISFLIEHKVFSQEEIITYLKTAKNIRDNAFDKIDIALFQKYFKSLSYIQGAREFARFLDYTYKTDLEDYFYARDFFEKWYYQAEALLQIKDIPVVVEKYCVRKNYGTLYRGLSWNLKSKDFQINDLITSIDYNKVAVGDIIDIDFRYITSWSTRKSVGDYFAKGKDYGLTLEISNVNKSQVFCDIGDTFPRSNIFAHEEEVALYPGRLKCKVVSIFRKNTLVKSTKSIKNINKMMSIDKK